jgi:hypothetical protein
MGQPRVLAAVDGKAGADLNFLCLMVAQVQEATRSIEKELHKLYDVHRRQTTDVDTMVQRLGDLTAGVQRTSAAITQNTELLRSLGQAVEALQGRAMLIAAVGKRLEGGR